MGLPEYRLKREKRNQSRLKYEKRINSERKAKKINKRNNIKKY